MPTLDLVLIRHGRIAGRPLRPRNDDPLSELGIEQARRAGDYLAKDPTFPLMVTSPLLRAMQTAQIIASRLMIEPVIVEELKEMSSYELRRVLFAELAERLPLGRREARLLRGARLRAPLVGRIGGALAHLTVDSEHERLLIIAHGGVIWSSLAHYFPARRRQFSRGRQVANGSVTRIRLTAAGAELIALNETAHLGELVTY